MNIFRPFGELEFILPDIAFTDENRKCQAAFVCLQHVAFKAWKQIFHRIDRFWHRWRPIFKFAAENLNHGTMKTNGSERNINKIHTASIKAPLEWGYIFTCGRYLLLFYIRAY